MKPLWSLLFSFAAFGITGERLAAETTAEKIFFLKPDGVTYLNYSTTRSGHPNYSLFLKEEETEDLFDYIYPNDYTFEVSPETGRKVILFEQGSHATLRPGTLNGRVTQENGVFTFLNWDEAKNPKLPGGYFGEWNAPDNFSQYAYVWVMPDNLEIVSFESNQPEDKGTWRLRRNTLAWFGEDVNNIVFKIQYRARTSRLAELVRSKLLESGSPPVVEILAEERDVRVVLPSGTLFPPGSVTLSEAGKVVLGQLASALKDQANQRFIVEGHTDDAPVTGEVAKRYSSNWELSAARSLAVVGFLEEGGIPGHRLESRAFGAYHPVADNGTEEGRAANRRIEIRILSER